MCRDINKFSHFSQIIFLNSLQAPIQSPAEQTPRVSPLATLAFLLFIPQIKERRPNHHPQRKELAAKQVLNISYIHRELSNLFIIRYFPGPSRPPQCAYFKMADELVSLSLIPFISASSWTKGGQTLETVEAKSLKGTIFHVSTCHHGLLVQWIRCGVHQSGIAVHSTNNPQHYQLLVA